MGCDFVLQARKQKFGQPEVSLGLIPGYAGTQRLPRLTGMGDALYLLMTTDMIGADEALRIGLIQKVFEPELLMEETMKIAKIIISKGSDSIRKVKRVVREGLELSFTDGEKLEAKQFGTLFGEGNQERRNERIFGKTQTGMVTSNDIRELTDNWFQTITIFQKLLNKLIAKIPY